MIEFKREKWKDTIAELNGFWQRHYDELSVNKDAVPLDMWLDRYQQLEDSGTLFLMTGRDDGKLIAYFIGVVQPHLHFQSTLHYFSDLYYFDPTYRGKGLGSQGMKALKIELKSLGVIRVYFNTKCHQDHSDFFEKHNFKRTDYQYSTILEQEETKDE